ncbi:hypothetical protein DY000_02015099 [Brassica cretica]|uniref:Uncharacterized protein n=1 Tax=Brassica cretica TaxID=69181 RepID=A0ABQ7DET9_BRACR|nr:hypothetical protein DY000_02015099 [Brassica cretica]
MLSQNLKVERYILLKPIGSGRLFGAVSSFWTRRLLLDPEVAFGPGGYKEPGGLPFPGPEEICSGPGDCLGTRRKPLSDLEGAGMGENPSARLTLLSTSGEAGFSLLPDRSSGRSRSFVVGAGVGTSSCGWEKTCVLWPPGVVPSLHAYRGQDIASLFPSSSLVWAVFEPGEGSAFLSDSSSPSSGFHREGVVQLLVLAALCSRLALLPWFPRGRVFPWKYVDSRSLGNLEKHVALASFRSISGLRSGTWKLGSGIWKLEPGTWKLGSGTWKLGSGTQRDPVLVLASNYATTVSMVLYSLRGVFWDPSCASFRSDENKSFFAPGGWG